MVSFRLSPMCNSNMWQWFENKSVQWEEGTMNSVPLLLINWLVLSLVIYELKAGETVRFVAEKPLLGFFHLGQLTRNEFGDYCVGNNVKSHLISHDVAVLLPVLFIYLFCQQNSVCLFYSRTLPTFFQFQSCTHKYLLYACSHSNSPLFLYLEI